MKECLIAGPDALDFAAQCHATVIVMPVGARPVDVSDLRAQCMLVAAADDPAAIAEFVLSVGPDRVIVDPHSVRQPLELVVMLREILPPACECLVRRRDDVMPADRLALLEDDGESDLLPVVRPERVTGIDPVRIQMNTDLREIDRLRAERDGLAQRVEALENALRGVQGVGAVVRVAARTSSPRVAHHLTRVYRLGLRVTGRR